MKDDLMIIAGLGVVALVAITYLAKKAGDAGSAIGDGLSRAANRFGGVISDAAAATTTAVNPIDEGNLVYQGSSAVVGIFADYPGATVGSMFADTFKPSSERDVDEMLRVVPVAPKKVLNSAGTLTDSSYRDLVR